MWFQMSNPINIISGWVFVSSSYFHNISIFKTQVEELAFLIKDNLPCKHLVLSMEEALVDFLQDSARYLSDW